MKQEIKKEIIDFLEKSEEDIYYGKIRVELTMTKGELVNIKKKKEESKRIE